jgi:predicted nuclease with TOPRIM domain
MSDEKKLINVRHELGVLDDELSKLEGLWETVRDLYGQLKAVNEELWIIEDEIRIKEAKKEFDVIFIDLARSVYVTNDKRANIKKEINLKMGSDLVEEKSYEDYQ